MRIPQCLIDALDDFGKSNASSRMRLRIEEYLGMQHVLRLGLFHVGPCQIIEVALLPQDVGSLIIKVQKPLQVLEGVRCAQRFDRWIRQRNAVATSELEHHLGLERALEVQVQLRFRQPLYEVRDIAHDVELLRCRHQLAPPCSSDFASMTWMPLEPLTVWVTRKSAARLHKV